MIEGTNNEFDFGYADIDSLPDFPENRKFAELDEEYKGLLKENIQRETANYWSNTV